MKKMARKMLSVFLAGIMAFSMLPTAAFAKESNTEILADSDVDYNNGIVEKTTEEGDTVWYDLNDGIVYGNGDRQAANENKLGPSSRSIGWPGDYTPFRKPERVLTEDYGYTSSEATAILNQNFSDDKIRYVNTYSDFTDALANETVEILIFTSDEIVATETIKIDRSIAILSAKKRTLAAGEGLVSKERLIKISEKNDAPIIDRDITLTFSNIVIDCRGMCGGLIVDSNPNSGPIRRYNKILIESAWIENTHYTEGKSGTPAIFAVGNVSLKGCAGVKGCADIIVHSMGEKSYLASCYELNSDFGMGFDMYTHFGEDVELFFCISIFSGGITVATVGTGGSETYKESQAQMNYCLSGTSENEQCYFFGGNLSVVMDECEVFSTRRQTSNLVQISCNHVTVNGMEVNGWYPYGFANGFSTGEKKLTLNNCKISEINGYGEIAIDLYESCSLELNNTTINDYDVACRLRKGRTSSTTPAPEAYVIGSNIHDNKTGFQVSNGAQLQLEACQIQNNSVTGIKNEGGTINVVNTHIENNGSDAVNGAGGIWVDSSDECAVSISDSEIKGNTSAVSGGGINIPGTSTGLTVSNCQFVDNTASVNGGAIQIGDLGKLVIDESLQEPQTTFSGNTAATACYPPENAATLYPNIRFSTASLLGHPLNNYDINYAGVTLLDEISAVQVLEDISVHYGTTGEEVQSQLEAKYPQIQVSLSDGTSRDDIPVIWSVEDSDYNGESRGTYMVHGQLDLSGLNIVNPTSLTADVKIQVTADIVSVQKFEEYVVEHETPAADVQAALEEKYPQAKVTLSDGQELDFPVNWNVASSDYNGDAYGTYLVSGEIIFADEPEVRNPDGLSAKIDIQVLPDPGLEIVEIVEVPINVRQYILLSNINKPTDLPGHEKPTTAKLPEKVTVKLKGGETAELPVNWNVEGYDSSKVGVQNFTGEVVTDGTQITNLSGIKAPLKVTVSAADYMFIQAAPTDISVEVLPGTSVEEINAKLVEEGKADISLNAFDMESGRELYTFYRIALQEKDCVDYQKDVPGEYGFTIPWPDNIIIADGLEDTDVKVHVTVREPLDIIGVDTAAISPYQSVPCEDYTDIPAQVNVTLEGGLKVPVDVEWDWSAFNPDVAGEQIVIGELVNLPSKAKQPEGKEFTGKLAVSVQPVDYKITNREYGMIQSDAALTLAEITELYHPTVVYEITSVTEGVDLTLEREVAVMLEDEKNPEYDPKVAKEYYLTGTLDLPENITYDNEEQLFDEILLLTEPVDILSFTTESITASEGTPFEDIQFKPTEVEAVLSAVGPDGKNKTEIIAVNWSGEGYNPFPEGLTDDEPLAETVTGSLVNKPAYIKTPKKVKPILFIKVGREFIIESITPNRFPETGAMEVPLGSGLKDIESKLEQRTVSVNLLSTNGVRSTTELTYTLEDDELNQGYDPDTLGTYTLTATLPLEDNYRNPDNLKVEVVVETMTYYISTTKITTLAGIVSGTPFEELPLPAKAIAVRDDDVDEELDVTWDGSNYNPTKIGAQFINGTFNTPLPKHLENPDNRQPKAFVTVVRPNAKILSMEQVFDEPAVMLMSAAELEEEIPGYTEYRYLVKLQNEDGSIEEQIISMYSKTE